MLGLEVVEVASRHGNRTRCYVERILTVEDEVAILIEESVHGFKPEPRLLDFRTFSNPVKTLQWGFETHFLKPVDLFWYLIPQIVDGGDSLMSAQHRQVTEPKP